MDTATLQLAESFAGLSFRVFALLAAEAANVVRKPMECILAFGTCKSNPAPGSGLRCFNIDVKIPRQRQSPSCEDRSYLVSRRWSTDVGFLNGPQGRY